MVINWWKEGVLGRSFPVAENKACQDYCWGRRRAKYAKDWVYHQGTIYWKVITSLQDSKALCLLLHNSGSANRTLIRRNWPYNRFFLDVADSLPPSRKKKLARLIMWPFFWSKKTSRCFPVVSQVVSSEPSTPLALWSLMDLSFSKQGSTSKVPSTLYLKPVPLKDSGHFYQVF